MRYAPPPVRYPVDRPIAGAVPAALASVACASACAAWALQAAAVDLRVVSGAVACALAIAWNIADWRSSPRGWLSWNGAGWHWRGHATAMGAVPAARGAEGAVPAVGCDACLALHLDLQAVMLVRLRPIGDAGRAACPRWLWLERRRAPGAWDDLRRAVMHPAPSDGAAGTRAAGADQERAAP